MSKDLRAIVDQIHELPTLPQIVVQLLKLLNAPDASAEDVRKALERDPVLAGKVLRLVNSAFYGLPNKVTTVRHAVVILGFRTIRSLVLSASVFDMFGDGGGEFPRVAFWSHSVGVAAVARMLAREEPELDEETAFVAGLLHDIGKLVLHNYAHKEFRAILRKAKEEELSFADAEGSVLDTTHAEIGAWLAERWRLPESLRLAIGHHHRIAEVTGEAAALGAVVSFADHLCHRRQIGRSGCFALPALDPQAWALLSIRKENLPNLAASLEKELIRAQGLLGMVQPVTPPPRA